MNLSRIVGSSRSLSIFTCSATRSVGDNCSLTKPGSNPPTCDSMSVNGTA